MLTELDKKIISHLLEMASNEFSNHGCNDFNLEELIPNAEDRRKLAQDMEIYNRSPEQFDPVHDYKYTMDWFLMSYFANKIKNC